MKSMILILSLFSAAVANANNTNLSPEAKSALEKLKLEKFERFDPKVDQRCEINTPNGSCFVPSIKSLKKSDVEHDASELQVAEKSDEGLRRTLSRPQPLKAKEPVKKSELKSGELYAHLPGDQRVVPDLNELRTMDPKLVRQLFELLKKEELRHLPKRSELEKADSELQVSANTQAPEAVRIQVPTVKVKNMDELMKLLREAPTSYRGYEGPKKSEFENSDASADASA